jgi:RimJ/RimL family protein N-acetyltransferase
MQRFFKIFMALKTRHLLFVLKMVYLFFTIIYPPQHEDDENNVLSYKTHYPAHNKTTDRTLPFTQHWVGYDGEIPFVYLLTSNVDKQVDSVCGKHAQQTGHAITLDIFIGNTDYLGKGIATITIQTFLSDHFSDVGEIFIDPEKTNTRAVHIYQKAGFSMVDEFIAPWHPVPHYLMMLSSQLRACHRLNNE